MYLKCTCILKENSGEWMKSFIILAKCTKILKRAFKDEQKKAVGNCVAWEKNVVLNRSFAFASS
jgi:hypothetical protein